MIEAVDEGVPHYMDQKIHNITEEALGALIHKRAAHASTRCIGWRRTTHVRWIRQTNSPQGWGTQNS